jgi:hypothetical protein
VSLSFLLHSIFLDSSCRVLIQLGWYSEAAKQVSALTGRQLWYERETVEDGRVWRSNCTSLGGRYLGRLL